MQPQLMQQQLLLLRNTKQQQPHHQALDCLLRVAGRLVATPPP
jgi:hypothetical protein